MSESSNGQDVGKATPLIGWSFFLLFNLGLFFVAKFIVGLWLGSSIVGPDRIAMAAGLVMQIDSFMVAGYVIGFFQFQGQVAKMIEEIAMLKEKNLTWGSGKRSKYFAGRRFFLLMSVIVLFILSGLYAVRASLFETQDEIVSSLSLLILGTLWMVLFWYSTISNTESMAERIGKTARAGHKEMN